VSRAGDFCTAKSSESTVSTSEGGEVVLLDAWKGVGVSDDSKSPKRRSNKRTKTSMSMWSLNTDMLSIASSDAETSSCSPTTRPRMDALVEKLDELVIPPDSRKAIIWEVMCLVCLLWDLVMIPCRTFNLGFDAFLTAMLGSTAAFWTCDIVLAFFVGYISAEGSSIVNFGKVFKRYLLTRCPVDALLVACSWTAFAIEVSSRQDRTAIQKVGKLLIALQFLRLHRLKYMWRFVEKLIILVRTEGRLILAYISFVIFLFLIIIHIMGCLWHVVDPRDDTTYTATELYVVSIHTVLALIVGEHIRLPQNMAQRLVMLLILFIGFIISAVFVGSLTTAMTRLQFLARQRSALFASLNRFLSERLS
jgi:hypothetical protein